MLEPKQEYTSTLGFTGVMGSKYAKHRKTKRKHTKLTWNRFVQKTGSKEPPALKCGTHVALNSSTRIIQMGSYSWLTRS